ncbi:hypothetical protein [Nonomuraea sp. NPDC050202]|uniref:hypothetical protein n=1 Tax=Nonomuraea sp. NPDC050202 TaxID=3155035 RepID=UPI0033D010DB
MTNINRRTALRLAAGTSIAAISGLGATAAPAHAAQHLWGTCTRCRILWFTGNDTRGGCPSGNIFDGGHHFVGIDWVVKTVEDGGAGQHHWRWCAWCQVLWFNGGTGETACPSSPIGMHSAIGQVVVGQPIPTSGHYVLEDIDHRDAPGGNPDFRWCFKCSGLWDSSNSLYTRNVCPRDHQPHSLSGSGHYVLRPFGSTRVPWSS